MSAIADSLSRRPFARSAAGIAATALLAFFYARGGNAWPLGFVALVPWMASLSAETSLVRSLVSAWAMTVAFTLAVFAWFGSAIGAFTQWGEAPGLAILLVAAPLLQPQLLAFALARHVAGRRHGPALRALAGASAWIAAEWLVPRPLGDTLGDGLYPARLLRQAADLAGATGLSFALLLANEGVALAIGRRRQGLRSMARPLGSTAAIALLLAGYGAATLSATTAPAGRPLRVALVQSNIADYEQRRREQGAAAVVREVLDTHFAMSYDAVERQHADAVLWSETVYPTTFGHPRSEAGAELDRAIQSIVDAARVPFVFGTYDIDAAGEYNAAAFVEPGKGLLGFYRKTRLFPLTESVPAWLDGPALRRWLPWAGTWKPGSGARVFPLRLADGREIPVLPLICRDDVDPQLAIDGARLGAQAILTMSNDAWFTEHPQGAALHQAVAAFRSIETRLPQFRVTTNGYSAVIDASGDVLAGARMGERTLVIGQLPVRAARPTLMVAWGDWAGRAAAAFLALWAALAVLRRSRMGKADEPNVEPPPLPADVSVLPPAARLVAGVLRTLARAGLLWMIAAVLLGDASLQSNTLAQIRLFVGLFLVPEAAAWCVLRAFAARASVADGVLVLASGSRRLELALVDIASAQPWRLPIPGPGLSFTLVSGQRWRHGLACARPDPLARALAPLRDAFAHTDADATSAVTRYARAVQLPRPGRLDHPLVKFGLLPLVLAIPAFRLHQNIAYGGSFGEYLTFGWQAYLATFALWWAAWTVGVVLCAAALRTAIEAGTLAGVVLAPARALDARLALERLGLAALYIGLPAWLMARIVGA